MSDISNIGSNSAIQGTNPNYANMTLDELMGVVMANRTNILDSQIRDRIMELDAKNQQLQKLNTAVTEVANAITSLGDGEGTVSLHTASNPDAAKALAFVDTAKSERASLDGKPDWAWTVMPGDMQEFFNEHKLEQGRLDWETQKSSNAGHNGYDFGHNQKEWDMSIKALEEFAAKQPDTIDPPEGSLAAQIKSFAPDHYQVDGTYTKQELEQIKETLKTQADNLSSTSQLEMTKLQSSMNKYNQSFELLSNFISKYAQSLNSIIGNTR